ncbi:MAG: methyltransferase domain-containing protein [Nitrospira sp.]|nr:methyltransferase domain-containing protein [Nitrospira sp.]MDF0677505.1 methyltransferase domain-containing protein [Nitrospira sp.]
MVAFVGEKKESIFKAVSEMYTDVANHPGRQFHFPTGRPACLFVGYPSVQLDAIPETAVESFAGVGYPFAVGAIQQGDRVLDIGSGSGTDALIASTLVGPRGKVYGLDMTDAMLSKARTNAKKMGVSHVEFLKGNAEKIALPDASIDSVTSNGVLNLVPDKPTAFGEIFRVLRPGGRIQIADIVLGKPIRPESRNDPQLWAECIVGAVQEEDYLALFRAAGLKHVTVIGALDYFSESSEADTREVAMKYGAKTVVITGSKPS